MAELHRAGATGDRTSMRQRALGIYRTLGDALALHDDLAFEPGSGDAAAVHGALLRVASGGERLFLDLLNLGRHRPTVVPAALAPDLARLDADVTATIEALARRLVEHGVAGIPPVPTLPLAASGSDEELRGFVRLYEVVFDALAALSEDLAALGRAVTPLTVLPAGRPSGPSPRSRTPAPQPS